MGRKGRSVHMYTVKASQLGNCWHLSLIIPYVRAHSLPGRTFNSMSDISTNPQNTSSLGLLFLKGDQISSLWEELSQKKRKSMLHLYFPLFGGQGEGTVQCSVITPGPTFLRFKPWSTAWKSSTLPAVLSIWAFLLFSLSIAVVLRICSIYLLRKRSRILWENFARGQNS